ncbi:hypothetical protein ERC79_07230 [Rhodococcus sp. ABRD24]|uniref:hypothetical protein n=1 Tax=Rhodococcus sp. ABRD24 TaxID=2507582 RepID=UPI00103A9E21|nr:hypothetical protein [Rhodococcus sp. ABRD24]QBJ95777.1 hypothetical protein ERC79_07230 [Rhodococcus sp. ABRD24]
MTLNDFAGWAGYGLALLGIATLGLFLVAAGSGFGGWALIAGLASLVLLAGSAGIFGGVTHHDHKVHHSTPHML